MQEPLSQDHNNNINNNRSLAISQSRAAPSVSGNRNGLTMGQINAQQQHLPTAGTPFIPIPWPGVVAFPTLQQPPLQVQTRTNSGTIHSPQQQQPQPLTGFPAPATASNCLLPTNLQPMPMMPVPATMAVPNNLFTTPLVEPLTNVSKKRPAQAIAGNNHYSNKQPKQTATIQEPSVVSSRSSESLAGHNSNHHHHHHHHYHQNSNNISGGGATTVTSSLGGSSCGGAGLLSSNQPQAPQLPPMENVNVETALDPAEQRRFERNMREQQRSYRISQQIKLLRDVLEENKIPFKPNKFSILVSVVEYIKQLQAGVIMLDSEHGRLVETIRETNNMVQNRIIPSTAASNFCGEMAPLMMVDKNNNTSMSTSSTNDTNKNDTTSSELAQIISSEWLVKGLDFYSIFCHCPSALAVASLDGRVLSCNSAFELLLCVRKDDIIEQSMFMYIRNHQDLFEAMADLLKRTSEMQQQAESLSSSSSPPPPQSQLCWCGHVITLHSKKLAFSITIAHMANGDPKYFSLSAGEDAENDT